MAGIRFGYLDKDIRNQNEKLKAAQASSNAMNESLSRDHCTYRGDGEPETKGEKAKIENDAMRKRTSLARGLKTTAIDYHPVPKTEDIKGLES
uniref:hypothetical protein n=1 Tax=Klebsiella pneumoniae TaxID=573 RepID=UPI003F88B099